MQNCIDLIRQDFDHLTDLCVCLIVLWVSRVYVDYKVRSRMQTVRIANPQRFLTKAETDAVNAAVREAERSACAEVKVVLVRHCWGSLKTKAHRIFKDLGLDKTKQRNCVLLVLVVTNREFLIYGDEGIHEKVGPDFWSDVRDDLAEAFRQDRFGEGIAHGVRRIGEKLAHYFPLQQDDIDEVSNEIIYRR